MDATNRDIFISEFIIHYLQSRYPNKYSDQTIVNKYKEYRKLRILKEVSDQKEDKDGLMKMSDFDLQRLKDLNEYFYGTSDGSNPSSGNNIARDYQILLSSVKHIIEENDNAIKDIVSNITSLLESSSADSPDPNIAKIYLEKVVLEPLIIALESSFDEELKITQPVLKVNDISEKTKEKMFEKMVIDENKEIKQKKDEAKEKKEVEIKKLKDENDKKDTKIKEENKEEAKKAQQRLTDKDIRTLFGKLTTCYNESKNLMKEDIYIEAIEKYHEKYLKVSNTTLPEIKTFFEEIKKIITIKKELEAKKIKEIEEENEEKLKDNTKLLEHKIKLFEEKTKNDLKKAENEKQEAEIALLIKGLDNNPLFRVKFNDLTQPLNLFEQIKNNKDDINNEIDRYITNFREYVNTVIRFFDELISNANKYKKNIASPAAGAPPLTAEEIEEHIKKLNEFKIRFDELAKEMKALFEDYKKGILSKKEHDLAQDILDVTKINSLSKNLKDLFFDRTDIDTNELDKIKEDVLNFLDNITTIESLNILKNYLNTADNQVYTANDTNQKINFIKSKFNIYLLLPDIFIDDIKQKFDALKPLENELKEEYEKLLQLSLSSLTANDEQLKTNYENATQK